MNFQFSIFKLFSFLILTAVFLPFLVFAQAPGTYENPTLLEPVVVTAQAEQKQGLVPCGPGTAKEFCDLCDIFSLIDRIVALILKVSIPIAVLVIAYGGILMASAGGSEDRLKKGKSAVSSAVIGLFLVFGAWLIVDFVLGNLLQEGTIYLPWNVFPGCG